MRRIITPSAVVVAAVWWLGCVALYVTVLAELSQRTESLPLALMFGSMAAGLLAVQALRLSGGAKLPPSSPFVIAVCVAGFLCMGVQPVADWRIEFGDPSGGALSGDPGGPLPEQPRDAGPGPDGGGVPVRPGGEVAAASAFFVMFSSIVMGMALHAGQVSRGSWVAVAVGAAVAGGSPPGAS